MQQIKRYLLIMLGFISIVLGLIGIVLPLLPTTPFFILALACFARSSERFHQKLLTAPYIGKTLCDWEKYHALDKKRKSQIMLTIVITFFISILLLANSLILQLILLGVLGVLLYSIYRIAER